MNNQVLQVISIGSTDNYLDMLTQEWGNCDQPVESIKNCALSNLSGDCQLIKGTPLSNPFCVFELFERIYMGQPFYFNENKEIVVDS
jgi:hypothetical protein